MENSNEILELLGQILAFLVSTGIIIHVTNRIKKKFQWTGQAAAVLIAILGSATIVTLSMVLPETVKVQLVARFNTTLIVARFLYEGIKGDVNTLSGASRIGRK